VDQRFRPTDRLLTKAAFGGVFRKSVRSADGLFTVLARPHSGQAARLGMAVSVKSAGGAVDRNRVKRLVREKFRMDRPRLPEADIVVMSRPGISAASNARIRESLEGHWKRIAKKCNRSLSD